MEGNVQIIDSNKIKLLNDLETKGISRYSLTCIFAPVDLLC